MKIVILDGYTSNTGDLSWAGINALTDELVIYDRTKPCEIVERCSGAQIVLTNKVPLGKSEMEQLPELKYIGVMATGFNVIDIAAARERGIVVTNVPAYSTMSVAQLTFALLLAVCSPVQPYNDAVKAGGWVKALDPTFYLPGFPLIELQGQTMAIVGLGQIGSQVAKIAIALGMKVLAWTSKSADQLPEGIEKAESLEHLFSAADVLTLHCPLTETTRELVNAERLALMKPSAIIINTSRGAVINEQDLANALNSGKIRAAALDVLTVEPAQSDCPLLSAKNCLLTPHVAWATVEARTRLIDVLEKNIAAWLSGKPQNVVNK